MKKIIALIIPFLFSCGTNKSTVQQTDSKLYKSLALAVLLDNSRDSSFCVINKSAMFEFKFPEKSGTGLSEKEIDLIEKSFVKEQISWSDIIPEYIGRNNINCVTLSKPVILKEGKEAFIYSSRLGASNYDLYEWSENHWKHKKNLIKLIE